MLNNKSILITGGTGSFGKQFTKSILKEFDVKKLFDKGYIGIDVLDLFGVDIIHLFNSIKR